VSVFLQISQNNWVASNDLAFAIRDSFPVSPGHTLIVTRRLVADWFSATAAEHAALFDLVDVVKRQLDEELHPDGFNVGFNAGTAAGQTVQHLHVHVIPRFHGDMDDPRGGVRHVIPSRGNYLRSVDPLATGGEDNPFAQHVLPLFERASEIAIVAAFVQESGLDRIRSATLAALSRGAHIRIITGDYLEITQASALELLLDWQEAAHAGDEQWPGRLEAAVVEVDRLPIRARSFHPKAWRFESNNFGIAFVGSSNLSRSALDTGIEWNLRVDRDRDSTAYGRVRDAFEALWASARRLDAGWIADYASRARFSILPPPSGEVAAEPLSTPPVPHQAQTEALSRLRDAREQGHRRALVVLATGLGKTWLAVFDYAQLREELGRRPRLLFLAHRAELLRQAAHAYRSWVRTAGETARVGWFVGDRGELEADMVFASVAKLSRREHLPRLHSQRFDYIVVDEVHHAAADSYRRILDVVNPHFLLGLTATPDRADTADVLGLFNELIAFSAGIQRGVELGRLVPFHYFGVKDEIDYENIPWRNQRFDPVKLAAEAQTEARMQTLWRALQEHPGTRSLVFCCSVAHALYVKEWLRARSVRVAAVFAAEGSDDRETALSRLANGDLDAVCAVDVFNEGIDVPAIDRVVMLRPTESSVVFLQQLGRGLRAHEGKTAVTVIDFVGNHRVFLERLRALLSLATNATGASVREVLKGTGREELPAGCSVDLELEAKELLSRLFRAGGADEVERAYRELSLERGTRDDLTTRPTAGELHRMGYLPSRLRERHGSWFEFVKGEGDLSPDALSVLDVGLGFLREVEISEMTKSFKMVTLEALCEGDSLVSGMPLEELSLRCHGVIRRSPELLSDVADEELRAGELRGDAVGRWVSYWRRNPIAAWTGERRDRRTWFRLEGDRFVLDLTLRPELIRTLTEMTRELVDYRIAQYLARKRQGEASIEGFVCKVISNQRDPILKLPPRGRVDIPEGETDVRLPDGAIWQFRFVKEYCNVARPAGGPRNQLPDLLRGWFGPRAGQPGTAFQVRFHAGPDGLWIEPVQATAADISSRDRIVAYVDLKAAAGHLAQGSGPTADETVWLPVDAPSRDVFAVRVSGSSMDGGSQPLRDGDWALMRVCRREPASALENRVVLVEVRSETGTSYLIKRLSRQGTQWLLTSDNPSGPIIEPGPEMIPIARLERVVQPSDLAPPVGTVISEAELAIRFGVDDLEPQSDRHHGHLFIFVKDKGQLPEPDRVKLESVRPYAGETAFTLARRRTDGETFRYLGVARQTDDEGVWSIPDVDHATWRDYGSGRDVSRRLPEGAKARAELIVNALLAKAESERWLRRAEGNKARILGTAARGGVRIDGGPGGFAERTVSLIDLAWVVVAADDVAERGGVVDEARVNRLRYLEGVPKGSTRWIDTGWAISAWQATKHNV
jgi:superfamily II DNA or RNA helicase/diadenosine tetraphosphate (Ap4A) HIT family hydrolase/HKD family nuclease